MILDILDEHIDEAEALFERRLLAFDMLDLTGEDLAEFDRRLRAHLDGLLLGGDASWARCREFLTEGSVGQAFVAGMLACETPGAPQLQTLINALANASAEIRTGLRWACRLTVWAVMPDVLKQLLNSDHADVRAVALDALVHRKVLPPVEVLTRAMDSPHTAERIAGLQGAAQTQNPSLVPQVERHVFSDSTGVSAAALEALVWLDPARAVVHCRRILAEAAPCPEAAAGLLGVIGHRDDLGMLIEATAGEDSQVARAAVLALGNLGLVEAVPALITLLEHSRLGGVAGVSLKRIFGQYLPNTEMPPVEPDEDEDESGDWHPDDDLPRLSPQVVNRWWEAYQSHFSVHGRFRNGGWFQPGPPLVGTPLLLVDYEVMEHRFFLKGYF